MEETNDSKQEDVSQTKERLLSSLEHYKKANRYSRGAVRLSATASTMATVLTFLLQFYSTREEFQENGILDEWKDAFNDFATTWTEFLNKDSDEKVIVSDSDPMPLFVGLLKKCVALPKQDCDLDALRRAVEELKAIGGPVYEKKFDELIVSIDRLSKNKGGGCFVATAVYGDPWASEVMLLRNYRDIVLNRTTLGRLLIWLYYLLGPTAATVVKNHGWIKRSLLQVFNRYIVPAVKRKMNAGL